MQWLRELSIRYKLMLGYMLASLSILLFTIVIFTSVSVEQQKQVMTNSLREVSHQLAYDMRPFLVGSDAAGAEREATAMPLASLISSFYVLKPNNRIFAEFHKDTVSSAHKGKVPGNVHMFIDKNRDTLRAHYKYRNGMMTMIEPIIHEGELLGRIVVLADFKSVRANMQYMLELAITILSVVFLLVTLVSYRVQEMISKPILNVVDTIKNILDRGDYSLRVSNSSHDELGYLAHSFNDMLDTVQMRDEEQKAAKTEIQRLAYYDGLTGLPNRVFFCDLLRQAIVDAERTKTSFAVLYLDIDNFKQINDTLRHSAGDILLQQVARRLMRCLRSHERIISDNYDVKDDGTEIDEMARLGGDEFTILIKGLHSADDAAIVAKRIIDNVKAPFIVDINEVFVTASIGIAVYPDDGKDIGGLLKNADTAMYHAKNNGKNRYAFYSEQLNADILKKISTENDLRHAIDNEEFVLYYQPKLSLKTYTVVGVEVLIRWRHPKLGLLLPGEFIAVAEDTGLIVPIGEWIVQSVCRQIKEWKQAGIQTPAVAVNFSARQFESDAMLDLIAAELQDPMLQPKDLEIELTENIIMKDDDSTVAMLERIKSMGLSIAIDDFGTGYSMLGYLSRFPIDTLKIDMSFVRRLVNSPQDAVIAKTIIAMGHSLSLKVIAEGVETQVQLKRLAEYGCDEIQGYLVSKPVPAQAVQLLMGKKFEFEAMQER